MGEEKENDDPKKMPTPAPLLRPPIPGSRSQSGTRAPRLGLAIPASPTVKAVNSDTQQTEPASQKPAPPSLRLATPSGTNATPKEGQRNQARGRLPPLQITSLGGPGGSSETSAASRSGSSGEVGATGMSMSSFTQMLRESTSRDQLSAVSSSHSNFAGDSGPDDLLPDLEKLSIDKGRPLDVDDLDDAGWRAASRDKRIEEIGSLGEGAGGAVTRCKLKGGKNVFALKVCILPV